MTKGAVIIDSLFVLVSDADDDIVRCRWAETSLGECGGVCGTLQNATLSEVRT